MYLVHFWAGLCLGWLWNADQLKNVWTWIKTLFVPDVNTKWILIDCRGPVSMYSNLFEDPWNLDYWIVQGCYRPVTYISIPSLKVKMVVVPEVLPPCFTSLMVS